MRRGEGGQQEEEDRRPGKKRGNDRERGVLPSEREGEGEGVEIFEIIVLGPHDNSQDSLIFYPRYIARFPDIMGVALLRALFLAE